MRKVVSIKAPLELPGVKDEIESLGWRGRFPGEVIAALLDEVRRYSKILNLTGAGAARQLVAKHVYESALLATLVGGGFAGEAADLGSGNGFPGLVLAAMLPDAQFTLYESRQNRSAFLENAIAAAQLGNAKVENIFVNEALDGFAGRFELITSRAFAKLSAVLELASTAGKQGHLVGGFGIGALTDIAIEHAGYSVQDVIEYVNSAGNSDAAYLLKDAKAR